MLAFPGKGPYYVWPFDLTQLGKNFLNAFGTPALFELPPPSLDELNHDVARIAASVLDLLQQKGTWLEDADDAVAERNPSLAILAQAAIKGTLVFGPAGAKPVYLKNGPIREPAQVRCLGRAFSSGGADMLEFADVIACLRVPMPRL